MANLRPGTVSEAQPKARGGTARARRTRPPDPRPPWPSPLHRPHRACRCFRPPITNRKSPGAFVPQYAEVSQLAGGLAHEIRNPLSTVSLNLDLLAEDFQNPETPRDRRVLQRVERLQHEVHRLRDILESFLRFARVQALETRVDRFERDRRGALRLLRADRGHEGDRDPHLPGGRPALDRDRRRFIQASSLEPDLERRARHAVGRRADPDDSPRRPLGRARRDRHRRGNDRRSTRPDLRRLFFDPAGRERTGFADSPQDRRGSWRHIHGAKRARQGVAVYSAAPRERSRAPGPGAAFLGGFPARAAIEQSRVYSHYSKSTASEQLADGPADPRLGGRRRRTARRGRGREPGAGRLRLRRSPPAAQRA